MSVNIQTNQNIFCCFFRYTQNKKLLYLTYYTYKPLAKHGENELIQLNHENQLKKRFKVFQVSYVPCSMFHVACRISPVSCHLSPVTNGNSHRSSTCYPTMNSRLVCKDPKTRENDKHKNHQIDNLPKISSTTNKKLYI